jgi:hypothetical protein
MQSLIGGRQSAFVLMGKKPHSQFTGVLIDIWDNQSSGRSPSSGVLVRFLKMENRANNSGQYKMWSSFVFFFALLR